MTVDLVTEKWQFNDDLHWADDDYWYDDDDGRSQGGNGWDDDGGFLGYIETTVDPGYWVFGVTTVFCVLSVVMIPVLVILGERWEKKRQIQMQLKHMELQEQEENAKLEQERIENAKKFLGHSKKTSEEDKLVDVDLNSAPMPTPDRPHDDTSRRHTPATSPSSSKQVSYHTPSPASLNRQEYASPHNTYRKGAPSVISHATTAISDVTTRSLFQINGAISAAVDTLLLPKYPDDDEEFRSTIIGGGSAVGGGAAVNTSTHAAPPPAPRSTLSSAVSRATSRWARDASSDLGAGGEGSVINGRKANVLDAGLVGGRRRKKSHWSRVPGNPGVAPGGGGRAAAILGASSLLGGEDNENGEPLTDSESSFYGNIANDQNSGFGGSSAMGGGGGGGAGRWVGDVESDMSGAMKKAPSSTGAKSFLQRRRPRLLRKDSSASSALISAVDDISPNDAADADDPGKLPTYEMEEDRSLDLCCGRNALWKPATLLRGIHKLVDLAEYDHEMHRITKLAVPFVLDEVLETILDFIDIALVANFIGTDAVAAYAVAEIFIGTTDEFIGSIGDAESTLCPHALGAGNNFLCAQYVQISVFVFVVCSIPLLIMWAFVIDKAILWLGLTPHIAKIARDWTRVSIMEFLLEGVAESVIGLLEITEHEKYVAIMDFIFGILDAVVVAMVLALGKNVDLTTVAFVHLMVGTVYSVLTIGIAAWKGWYRQFVPGLVRSCGIANIPALKNVVKTAMPLAVGNFLAYSEWEILTLFAAHLGPAEVTVWALLGSLWEIFEATTEGIGEAAAIRVSYHLGTGNFRMAKVSSYKCLLISVFMGLFITSVFFMCGENVAVWLTKDPTLQNLVVELIPLMGLGNVTMTFGMTSWHIIGAQARYRLATLVALICSWFITVPLSAFSVHVLNLNLQGVVSAVVIGYSLTGTIMAYVLLRSDWERISNIIKGINQLAGVVASGGSSEEDESSASSKSKQSSSSDEASSSDSSSSDSDDSDSDDSDSDQDHSENTSANKSTMTSSTR